MRFLLILVLFFVGCSNTDVTIKRFECRDDKDCKKDKSCIEGKCVIQDEDGDGWSTKRDCDDHNKQVYPGRAEICDNKIDDYCNG